MQITMTKRKKYVHHNLQKLYPQKDQDEIKVLSKQHFNHLGQLIIELLTLPALTNEKYRNRKINYEGIDKIKNALALGTPALILTAHMGNWEMMTTMAAIVDTPFSALYKEQNNIFDRIIAHLRTCSGMIAIPNKKGLRGVIKALQNNEIIGVVADQSRKGKEYLFFGDLARFPTGAATFHLKHKAVAFPVFAIRDKNSKIKISILDPVSLSLNEQSLDKESQIDLFMKKYITILEKQILKYPEQYYWVHDVWRDFKKD